MPDAAAPLASPVESGIVPKKLYGIGAEFAGPKELYAAAEKVRDKGFKGWDCYTPYYIHGLDKAMGQGKSFVNLFTLAGGLGGLIGAFLLIVIRRSTSIRSTRRANRSSACRLRADSRSAHDPDLRDHEHRRHGGAQRHAAPAASAVGLEAFMRATHDKFFIVIEANDPRFNEKGSIDLLREVGGTNNHLHRGGRVKLSYFFLALAIAVVGGPRDGEVARTSLHAATFRDFSRHELPGQGEGPAAQRVLRRRKFRARAGSRHGGDGDAGQE